ncbi:helix-turn-helix domain-containing protein [Streptomyces sp. SID12488]|uniref:ArsR/SmtB family transcription factor n=1 Tax=Streptomyces sp. SID12488 TaxID=2706040 RepID=UPI0013DC809E|nr:helix-turn-helix domain-containing protein [Streptomyces sp. SID12488]NEA61664.1 helix-turn-helix transcriptional regulator [Streptomyces sp. SID12488]
MTEHEERPENQERTANEERKVRHLDARSLRGLAHPLRMQLLDALRRRGPATASQLAEKLGESSGATSYHLRQLATHGFVEDAPERGKGRERWWKAVYQGLSFDSSQFKDADPELRGATELYLHEIANSHTRELSTWLGTRDDWPQAWSRGSDMSSATLQLTPDLAEDLIHKMHELIEGYRSLTPDKDSPETEQVRVHTHLFPVKTD